MPSAIDRLVGDLSISDELRRDVEAYLDQGGMFGLLAHVLVALETDDALAANVASQLTVLFVASSLHDDAVDETPSTGRKRYLNERITVGDVALTHLIELGDELPGEAGPIAEMIREIGRGQLAEEAVSAGTPPADLADVPPADAGAVPPADPSAVARANAIARVDARGSVWGRLLATLVEATGCYGADQLERIETIATNLVFVYTVFDDVEDLREDVENGVVNAPLLMLDDGDGRTDRTGDADSAVESVVDSRVPGELEALVERRRERIDDASQAFHDAGGYSTAAILDAMERGLAWYCESICTTPLESTVSPELRDDVRRRLEGDDATRRAFVESTVRDSPLPTAAFPATDAIVEEVPPERLAPVFFKLLHVDALASERLTTSLDQALASLREST